jgi:hypothetical protein
MTVAQAATIAKASSTIACTGVRPFRRFDALPLSQHRRVPLCAVALCAVCSTRVLHLSSPLCMLIATRRRWVWGAAFVLVVAAGTAAAKERAKRKRWQTWAAICNYIEAFQKLSNITVDIARGVKAYTSGETDEVPPVLVHSLGLISSRPFTSAVSSFINGSAPAAQGTGVMDAVVDASLSDRGQNLLALVAAVSTTRAAKVFCSYLQQQSEAASGSSDLYDKAIQWLQHPAAQRLISRCVVDFVSSGTTAYCQATLHINPYEQILEAASKPEHLRVLSSLTSTFCQSTVRALACSANSGEEAALAPAHAHRNGVIDKAALQQHGNSGCQDGQSGFLWARELVVACNSAGVRQIFAESARAGSMGAVQAACEQLGESRLARGTASYHLQELFVAGAVLWWVLLPLVLICAVAFTWLAVPVQSHAI